MQLKLHMKQIRFVFPHHKKIGINPLIFLAILSSILLQKQRRSTLANTISEMNTNKYLNERSHTDTLTKGVAEQ